MVCSTPKTNSQDSSTEKVILIGNPNVGKSVIFNYLTGKYATVSNYPGTTVEIATGTMWVRNKKMQVIDTPGINSLIPMSEDEKVTRDILLHEPRAHLIQVIDAKNLRRGLLISLQLLEMGFSFLILLNMWDEAKSRGVTIRTQALSEALGVPVLKTVATRRKGLERIKEHLNLSSASSIPIAYPGAIESGVSRIVPLLPQAPISKRSLALMLLAGDESLREWLHRRLSEELILQIDQSRRDLQSVFSDSIGYLINQARIRKVDELLTEVMTSEKAEPHTLASTLGSLALHPFWGVPILLLVLLITYEFVGVFGAQVCVDFLEETVFGTWILPFLKTLTERFIPIPFLQELFIGPYGILTMAMTYAIAIVLPIVGCFFLLFGLMEDSGYLPRLAVMTNHIFKRMGLNGKAVLPMVLGLGCDTMATMTTRILETEKDRTIVTLLLALGVPCSAQLGVILGMFAGLPVLYIFIWIFVVCAVLVVVGYLAAKVLPGVGSDFILEIPPLRIPQVSNILVKTLARIEWYLKEAVPLFILGTLILFVFHQTNLLVLLERLASPLVTHVLGLPTKATEAFIIGFLRRDYGAAGLFMLAKDRQINAHQILVSLVTLTLFIPCVANLFVMIKERGMKKALWMVAFIFPVAFGVGGFVNLLLTLFGV